MRMMVRAMNEIVVAAMMPLRWVGVQEAQAECGWMRVRWVGESGVVVVGEAGVVDEGGVLGEAGVVDEDGGVLRESDALGKGSTLDPSVDSPSTGIITMEVWIVVVINAGPLVTVMSTSRRVEGEVGGGGVVVDVDVDVEREEGRGEGVGMGILSEGVVKVWNCVVEIIWIIVGIFGDG